MKWASSSVWGSKYSLTPVPVLFTFSPKNTPSNSTNKTALIFLRDKGQWTREWLIMVVTIIASRQKALAVTFKHWNQKLSIYCGLRNTIWNTIFSLKKKQHTTPSIWIQYWSTSGFLVNWNFLKSFVLVFFFFCFVLNKHHSPTPSVCPYPQSRIWFLSVLFCFQTASPTATCLSLFPCFSFQEGWDPLSPTAQGGQVSQWAVTWFPSMHQGSCSQLPNTSALSFPNLSSNLRLGFKSATQHYPISPFIFSVITEKCTSKFESSLRGRRWAWKMT